MAWGFGASMFWGPRRYPKEIRENAVTSIKTPAPRGALAAVAAAAMLISAAPVAKADAASDFYKGKTITVFVGYGPGGGYDTTTRIFARNFQDISPGGARVVVSNMPGSGSLRLANWLYNAAPKDGTR